MGILNSPGTRIIRRRFPFDTVFLDKPALVIVTFCRSTTPPAEYAKRAGPSHIVPRACRGSISGAETAPAVRLAHAISRRLAPLARYSPSCLVARAGAPWARMASRGRGTH